MLEHPNTVRLLDFGEDDGVPFLVWELLRGETLADRLQRTGAMAPLQVAKLAIQVLSSLEEAHAAGIVHRDIKPTNLMLCDFAGHRDFIKVLDFGVAKVHGGDDLTGEGPMPGTPRYMAPEQALGNPVVPNTDLYALGLVMAEALAGQAVIRASGSARLIALQVTEADLDIPPSVLDSLLGTVIRKATRKRMGARFSSAQEMRRAIQQQLDATHASPIESGSEVDVPHGPPSHQHSSQASQEALPANRTGLSWLRSVSTRSSPSSRLAIGGVFAALALTSAVCAGVMVGRSSAPPSILASSSRSLRKHSEPPLSNKPSVPFAPALSSSAPTIASAPSRPPEVVAPPPHTTRAAPPTSSNGQRPHPPQRRHQRP